MSTFGGSRSHMRKAGADEVISAADFGLRLMARVSLCHGMTRVYQELLSVRRDANEMYLVPVPAPLVGMDLVAAANVVPARSHGHEGVPAHRALPR